MVDVEGVGALQRQPVPSSRARKSSWLERNGKTTSAPAVLCWRGGDKGTPETRGSALAANGQTLVGRGATRRAARDKRPLTADVWTDHRGTRTATAPFFVRPIKAQLLGVELDDAGVAAPPVRLRETS